MMAATAGVIVTLAGVVMFQREQIKNKNSQIATLHLALKQSQEASQQCSDSVMNLREEARRKAMAHESAIKAAKEKADKAKTKADRILSTPPTVPGNDCQSASERFDNWLKERDK